jgi:hypothetical protein
MHINRITPATISVLKTSDSAAFALELMQDQRQFALPVVDGDGRYLGLADLDDVSDMRKNQLIKSLELRHKDQFLTENNSIYDALRLFRQGVSLVVLVDNEQQYRSAIDQTTLLHFFAQLGAIDHPGGYLSLRLPQYSYSLSEIARIAESNNAQIISLLLENSPESNTLELLLKFNITDLSYLIATFERFSYEVTGYHHQSNIADMYADRYWSLIRYLNT